MPMNVILLERVPKLGQMGDVVKVKPGFARNYLLPQKKALRATKDNITYFELQRKVLEAQNLERRGEAEAVAGKMKDVKVTLIRQASEALQLYGSVTSRDISDAANAAGVKIERSQVELDKPIKTLGAHKIKIHLHPEVSVEITALVARSRGRGRVPGQGRQAGRRERARRHGSGRSGTAYRGPGGCPVRGQDGRRRRDCRGCGCGSGRRRAGRRQIAHPSLGPASASNACHRPAMACVFV